MLDQDETRRRQIEGAEAALQLDLEQDSKAHVKQTMAQRATLARLDIESDANDRRIDRLANMAVAALGLAIGAVIISVVHVLWAH